MTYTEKRNKILFPKMIRFLKENNYYHILLEHPYLKKFFTFLYRTDGEKALGGYIKNVIYHDSSVFPLSQCDLLKSAFCWGDTKEGAFYWVDISHSWDDVIQYER